jgi:hypothetical protein
MVGAAGFTPLAPTTLRRDGSARDPSGGPIRPAERPVPDFPRRQSGRAETTSYRTDELGDRTSPITVEAPVRWMRKIQASIPPLPRNELFDRGGYDVQPASGGSKKRLR